MIQFDGKERAVAADKAQRDLYFYARWMMLQRRGIKWLRSLHHLLICDALMRVFRGEVLRLIVNIPPRYSKTELVGKFISFGLGHCPDAEFLYISYSAKLAADKTFDVREDVTSEPYREIFPDVQLITEGQGHWKTTRGGVVYAAGSDGTITGFGAGKMRSGFGGALIVDDPHKPDEVYSDVKREGVRRTFQNTVENRLNWANTPIILIMQRLHEQDLAGWLLAGGNGEKWEHLCLPAIQADGTALWPEKHSLATLQRMQMAAAFEFSGQYMQQPTPPAGGFFTEKMLLLDTGLKKPDGSPIYKAAPYPALCDGVFAVLDSATKTGARRDGVGVVYYALSFYGQNAWPLTILDYDLTQMDAALLETWLPNVFKRLEELAVQCKARQGSRGVHIEDKNSGSELLQRGKLRGMNVHAIDGTRTAQGKVERAVGVSGDVFAEQVKFSEHAYNKTVAYKGVTKNHLLSQVLAFRPTVADQGDDDLLDGFSYGCAIGLQGTKRRAN